MAGTECDMKRALLTSAVCCALISPIRPALAQQPIVFTTTPLQANGDRFFESTNMSWSLRSPHFFATFGGPNIGIPKFGGYNPNAGISSGWAFNSGKFSGNFRFNFSQGYERFSTTTAPSLTTLDGHTGQFFSGVRRPFVYPLVPVVAPGGAFFSAPSPAFHQQHRLPPTLAERVLRGEVLLPKSRSATRPGKPSAASPSALNIVDPTTARRNAAFAWFNDTPLPSPPQSKTLPPTDNSQAATGEAMPAEPDENQAAKVAGQIADSQPERSPDSSIANANSQRIAEVYYQRGLKAEGNNNAAKAKFLFRMAAERASGALLERIEKHLESLGSE